MFVFKKKKYQLSEKFQMKGFHPCGRTHPKNKKRYYSIWQTYRPEVLKDSKGIPIN